MEARIAWRSSAAIMILLLGSLQGVSAGSCGSKFSSVNGMTFQESTDAVCYYILDSPTCIVARVQCEAEDTQLVHVKTVTDQTSLNTLLGISQYWTGLFHEGGQWQWRVNSTYALSASVDTTSSRWELKNLHNPLTCVTVSGNRLKTQQTTDSAKLVCQDSAPTGASATTESPAATTTVATSQLLAGGADVWGLFQRESTSNMMTGALLAELPAVSRSQCAVRCVSTSGCNHFVFETNSALSCQLYDDGNTSMTCDDNSMCYNKV